MSKSFTSVLIAMALLACEERPLSPARSAGGPGAVLYLTYCESCHGERGQGNGPAAHALRSPPTDLTRLWERYGNPLDRKRLARHIDGRLLVDFHGSREMPVWGHEFFEDSPPDTPNLEAVRRRLIDVLIDHLQSLQSEQPT